MSGGDEVSIWYQSSRMISRFSDVSDHIALSQRRHTLSLRRLGIPRRLDASTASKSASCGVIAAFHISTLLRCAWLVFVDASSPSPRHQSRVTTTSLQGARCHIHPALCSLYSTYACYRIYHRDVRSSVKGGGCFDTRRASISFTECRLRAMTDRWRSSMKLPRLLRRLAIM